MRNDDKLHTDLQAIDKMVAIALRQVLEEHADETPSELIMAEWFALNHYREMRIREIYDRDERGKIYELTKGFIFNLKSGNFNNARLIAEQLNESGIMADDVLPKVMENITEAEEGHSSPSVHSF